MHAEFSHSVMSDSATPWTVAHQAPLSMGSPGKNTGVQNTPLSRQEYWSELPCPPPGDLPKPSFECRSPALQVDSLPAELPGKPQRHSSQKHLASDIIMTLFFIEFIFEVIFYFSKWYFPFTMVILII